MNKIDLFSRIYYQLLMPLAGIAGFIAVFAYFDGIKTKRENRSWLMIESYSSISTDLRQLSNAITSPTFKMNLADRGISLPMPKTIAEIEILNLINELKLNTSVINIFSFYDRVNICLEINACEEDIIYKHLYIDAINFWRLIGDPYSKNIKNDPNRLQTIGNGLRDFINYGEKKGYNNEESIHAFLNDIDAGFV